MKKRIGGWLVVAFISTLLLTACGEKSEESVVKKLEEKVEEMDGYEAKAEMIMETGKEEQKYSINVLHKKKDYYRVTLKDSQDEQASQVILKNEDGVFVLTPELDKSFKFQTDWPDNSSQPYLYQSLVQDILKDEEANFTSTDSHYIFKTKTNYQSNSNLPFQEIYFDKKSFKPALVKVLDKDGKSLVEVKFNDVEWDPKLAENDFQMDDENGEEQEKKEAKDDEKDEEKDEETSSVVEEEVDSFTVLFPFETAGSELDEQEEIEVDGGKRIIMTFTGDKSFTLIQEKLDVVPTLESPKEVVGDVVNLGFAVGAVSENQIQWNYQGVDYQLASEELTQQELIDVAKSVQGKEAK